MKKYICTIICVICCTIAGCSQVSSNWTGYQGTMEDYEYYYEDGRERAWEEDILSLAEKFLMNHTWLRNEESGLFYLDDRERISMNLFDEEKSISFLEGINDLIPNLSNLTDREVKFEIKKIVVGLNDIHSWVDIYSDYTYPIMFEVFYENDKAAFRVVTIEEQYVDFTYAKLLSINSIPIEEVIKLTEPYVEKENEYYFMQQVAGDITEPDLLAYVGIVEWDSETVDFELQKENGQIEIVTLDVISMDEWYEIENQGNGIHLTYEQMYKYRGKKVYWYEELENESALYVRISKFQVDEKVDFFEMSKTISDYVIENPNIEKIVVDLRGNPGGWELEGYKSYFLKALRDAKQVYVLIDSRSASRAVITAADIKNEVDGALLVGMPAAEGSFLLGREDKYIATSNFELQYSIGIHGYFLDKEKEFDALMPDILIYPTIEDYKNGVDTILEAVLQM